MGISMNMSRFVTKIRWQISCVDSIQTLPTQPSKMAETVILRLKKRKCIDREKELEDKESPTFTIGPADTTVFLRHLRSKTNHSNIGGTFTKTR